MSSPPTHRICNADWEPIDVQDRLYGVAETNDGSDARRATLTGYVHDDSWTKFHLRVGDGTLPTTSARGIYTVEVKDGEVIAVHAHNLAWWPRHPETDLPVTLPAGNVRLEFDAWTRYDRDRYGAARLLGRTDAGAKFAVYVPRDELPEDERDEFQGAILGGELAGVQPVSEQ